MKPDFERLGKLLRAALADTPLPGVPAQRKMAPEPLDGQPPRWAQPRNCRDAAVLVLLYPHTSQREQEEWHLILIERPEYDGVHSGQIAFPGGRREAQESLQQTALRESYEEVGVSPSMVTILGQLSPLYTPPSHFCVYPFVALSPTRPPFNPDPVEVANLIEIPLRLLQTPAIRREEVWTFDSGIERRVPLFDLFDYQIWGLTAMILSEFLVILNNTMGSSTAI